ncbi:hypothetical protein CHS0354_025258 [Potamilus streckersoni]|uniref:Reelin domain-containing protein n=1 Tax=Potamilus streckersoni TaxID=2493646 RepID=A0AAE0RRZ5_9BIVA|nr:hypothetical protein CHS0354_025258 [Potamilus streckersoni]
MLRCALLVIFLVASVFSLPTGAPPKACDRMVPGHGPDTVSGDPPYAIHISTTSYKAGSVITGSIVPTQEGHMIRGILLQARSTTNTSEMLGTFVPTSTDTHTVCGPQNLTALTHSNPKMKAAVTFSWMAPSEPMGDFIFRLTIVENFNPSQYWLNITSPIVSDCTQKSATDLDDPCEDLPTPHFYDVSEYGYKFERL